MGTNFSSPHCPGIENDGGSVKKEKEKKNRKKDKENGSGSGEAGNRKDIDAPDAVVSTVFYSPDYYADVYMA